MIQERHKSSNFQGVMQIPILSFIAPGKNLDSIFLQQGICIIACYMGRAPLVRYTQSSIQWGTFFAPGNSLFNNTKS
jgi:hypothetical protein